MVVGLCSIYQNKCGVKLEILHIHRFLSQLKSSQAIDIKSSYLTPNLALWVKNFKLYMLAKRWMKIIKLSKDITKF